MVTRFTVRDNILQADASGVYSLADNDSLSFGAGGDLLLSSDGTHGVIDAGAGSLKIGENSSSVILDSGAGTLNVGPSAATIGFFGATAASQPAAIGDPAESTAGNNAAIDSILAALRTLGLIAT